MRPGLRQHRERGATLGKEVFRMHLQKIKRRQAFQQFPVVGLAPADADLRQCGRNNSAQGV